MTSAHVFGGERQLNGPEKCGEAQREEYVNRFAVDHINDARGPPGNRFYLVHWLGKNETNVTIGGCAPGRKWTPTWEPERFLIDAQKRIDTFWNDRDHSMQNTIECTAQSTAANTAASSQKLQMV